MFDDCLIMAGGSGTRLWPASNSAAPKQFLPITRGGQGSFFSAAVERGLALIGEKNGRLIVIAGESHMPHVIADCAPLPPAQKKRLLLIPEPVAKNTAPAIACAVAYVALTGGESRNMLVLTSDHIIGPPEVFKAAADAAAVQAAGDRLVVFGIPPSRPETGYGYIEAGKSLGVKSPVVYPVNAFREKPDFASAKKFASSKRFFWNSGMFAFSNAFMTGCFRSLAPGIFCPFEKLKVPDAKCCTTQKGLRLLNGWPGLDAAYRNAKSMSFDYAIAEKCPDTVMVRAEFDWIDVGNWEEYARLLASDDASSAGTEVYRIGSEGCFVDSDIPVALAEVDDLIVVIRSGKNGFPGAALITRKGKTQRVRDVVELVKQAGRTELL